MSSLKIFSSVLIFFKLASANLSPRKIVKNNIIKIKITIPNEIYFIEVLCLVRKFFIEKIMTTVWL